MVVINVVVRPIEGELVGCISEILTTAHVRLLHSPDVGGALITRLHDVDLVVCKHMVQWILQLNPDKMFTFIHNEESV